MAKKVTRKWRVVTSPNHPYLHMNKAQDLGACVGIHLEHLIELAHLEEEHRVKVARLEIPPVTQTASVFRSSVATPADFLILNQAPMYARRNEGNQVRVRQTQRQEKIWLNYT